MANLEPLSMQITGDSKGFENAIDKAVNSAASGLGSIKESSKKAQESLGQLGVPVGKLGEEFEKSAETASSALAQVSKESDKVLGKDLTSKAKEASKELSSVSKSCGELITNGMASIDSVTKGGAYALYNTLKGLKGEMASFMAENKELAEADARAIAEFVNESYGKIGEKIQELKANAKESFKSRGGKEGNLSASAPATDDTYFKRITPYLNESLMLVANLNSKFNDLGKNAGILKAVEQVNELRSGLKLTEQATKQMDKKLAETGKSIMSEGGQTYAGIAQRAQNLITEASHSADGVRIALKNIAGEFEKARLNFGINSKQEAEEYLSAWSSVVKNIKAQIAEMAHHETPVAGKITSESAPHDAQDGTKYKRLSSFLSAAADNAKRLSQEFDGLGKSSAVLDIAKNCLEIKANLGKAGDETTKFANQLKSLLLEINKSDSFKELAKEAEELITAEVKRLEEMKNAEGVQQQVNQAKEKELELTEKIAEAERQKTENASSATSTASSTSSPSTSRQEEVSRAVSSASKQQASAPQIQAEEESEETSIQQQVEEALRAFTKSQKGNGRQRKKNLKRILNEYNKQLAKASEENEEFDEASFAQEFLAQLTKTNKAVVAPNKKADTPSQHAQEVEKVVNEYGAVLQQSKLHMDAQAVGLNVNAKVDGEFQQSLGRLKAVLDGWLQSIKADDPTGTGKKLNAMGRGAKAIGDNLVVSGEGNSQALKALLNEFANQLTEKISALYNPKEGASLSASGTENTVNNEVYGNLGFATSQIQTGIINRLAQGGTLRGKNDAGQVSQYNNHGNLDDILQASNNLTLDSKQTTSNLRELQKAKQEAQKADKEYSDAVQASADALEQQSQALDNNAKKTGGNSGTKDTASKKEQTLAEKVQSVTFAMQTAVSAVRTFNNAVSEFSGNAIKAESNLEKMQNQLSMLGQFKNPTEGRDFLVELSKETGQTLSALSAGAEGILKAGGNVREELSAVAKLSRAVGVDMTTTALSLEKAFTGDSRGILLLQRYFGIAKEDMVAFGAELNKYGKVAGETAEQQEKLKNAILAVIEAKMGDSIERFNGTLEGLQEQSKAAQERLDALQGETMSGLVKTIYELQIGFKEVEARLPLLSLGLKGLEVGVPAVVGIASQLPHAIEGFKLMSEGIGACKGKIGTLVKDFKTFREAGKSVTEALGALTIGTQTFGASMVALKASIITALPYLAVLAAAVAGVSYIDNKGEEYLKNEKEKAKVLSENAKKYQESKVFIDKYEQALKQLGKTTSDSLSFWDIEALKAKGFTEETLKNVSNAYLEMVKQIDEQLNDENFTGLARKHLLNQKRELLKKSSQAKSNDNTIDTFEEKQKERELILAEQLKWCEEEHNKFLKARAPLTEEELKKKEKEQALAEKQAQKEKERLAKEQERAKLEAERIEQARLEEKLKLKIDKIEESTARTVKARAKTEDEALRDEAQKVRQILRFDDELAKNGKTKLQLEQKLADIAKKRLEIEKKINEERMSATEALKESEENLNQQRTETAKKKLEGLAWNDPNRKALEDEIQERESQSRRYSAQKISKGYDERIAQTQSEEAKKALEQAKQNDLMAFWEQAKQEEIDRQNELNKKREELHKAELANIEQQRKRLEKEEKEQAKFEAQIEKERQKSISSTGKASHHTSQNSQTFDTHNPGNAQQRFSSVLSSSAENVASATSGMSQVIASLSSALSSLVTSVNFAANSLSSLARTQASTSTGNSSSVYNNTVNFNGVRQGSTVENNQAMKQAMKAGEAGARKYMNATSNFSNSLY